jgi:hypothetical protein
MQDLAIYSGSSTVNKIIGNADAIASYIVVYDSYL